jgi:transposase-like protein
METQGSRTSRGEWQKRIERWRDSGLTAEQFAAELGINAGTLRFWKYRLGKDSAVGEAGERKPRTRNAPQAASLVEVHAATMVASSPFVLELGKDRRLQIPSQFDASALERLLSVLEQDDSRRRSDLRLHGARRSAARFRSARADGT